MRDNLTAPSNTGPSFADRLATRNADAVAKGNGTHLQMVDTASAKSAGNAAAEAAKRASATANTGKAVAKTAGRMSGGKIAAIVAGVGVLAGATYMLTRPSEDKRSWTARVDQQRADTKGAALGA